MTLQLAHLLRRMRERTIFDASDLSCLRDVPPRLVRCRFPVIRSHSSTDCSCTLQRRRGADGAQPTRLVQDFGALGTGSCNDLRHCFACHGASMRKSCKPESLLFRLVWLISMMVPQSFYTYQIQQENAFQDMVTKNAQEVRLVHT